MTEKQAGTILFLNFSTTLIINLVLIKQIKYLDLEQIVHEI